MLRAEQILSPSQLEALLAKKGITLPAKEKKPHKYRAKYVVVDGHKFPSLLEAQCYSNLKLQWQGGLITEPLRQVRFSLGVHNGCKRWYVSDFVFIERGELVVADAKGHKTKKYLQDRKMMLCLYGIGIREYRKIDL